MQYCIGWEHVARRYRGPTPSQSPPMLPGTSRSKGALQEPTATTAMDHRRRSHAASASPSSSSSAHDVDARITIPMASTASTITHRPARGTSTANGKPSELLLRSGISKYRSLSGKNTSNSSSGGTSNAAESQGGNASARAYTRGSQLMDQKQYAAAIPFFSDALLYATNNGQSNKKPSHQGGGGMTAASTLKIHLQRGTCYLAAQRYQAAVEDFTRVIEATPGQPALYVKRARAHAKLQHYSEALADYHEVIESLASSPTLEFAGGHAQTELRNLLLERAHVYHEMNNQTKALSDLTRAEQADGTRDATLYYQRSQIYMHIHQPTLALQDLDRVLELRSADVLEEDNGADDTQQVRPAMPTRLLEILLEHAKLTQQIAYENEAQQRKDVELMAVEQGESSRSAITRDQHGNGPPEGYKSSDARALLQRAITDYTQILAVDPDHIEALHKRGQAYGFLEAYDLAFADFMEALRREPGDFEVHMSRAKLFQQQRRLQDAIREVTHVIEVNGFFVDALFFRARLFEQTEDWTKAQLDYSSIIEAQLDVQGVSTISSSAPTANNAGRSGSKLSGQKGSNGKASVPPPPPPPPIVLPKKTSDIAAQALLLRARISLHQEEFENAAADYERILKSNPNHLEAQLEKQETQAKKIECENRKQQEALMWLEEKQMLEDQLGTGVDAAGKEQQTRNGSATGKAKKKKKKKKKKPNHSAYVLLVDEEVEEVSAKPTTSVEPEIKVLQEAEEHEPVKMESESELRIPSQDKEPPVTVPSASRVYVAITRDEACESMWEQADEPIEMRHRQRMRWRELEEEELEEEFSRQDEDTAGSTLLMDEHEVEKPLEIAAVEETEDDNGEEDTGGSTTDSVGAPSTVREVLVDDKYLKKRQKQLEKLRANFLEVCLTRDRLGIEEVMERAERKQMSEQLSTEIERAKEILESIQKQQEDVAKTIQSSLRSAGFIDIESSETHEAEPISPPRMKPNDTPRIKQQPVEQEEEDPTTNVNKPPSLVIRPFAYGQALQQAEQHQHQQLLHHQRLLQEKDAEIAYLRDLLAQANRAASIEHDQLAEDGLTDRLVSLRTKFPHHALRAMESRVGQLVNIMGPSPEADHVRFKILSFVHRVFEANFPPATPILFFPMGSFPMKTYLPAADLDVCLLLPKELEPTWHFAVLHALCLAGSSHPDAIAEAAPMMNGSPNGKRVTPLAGSPTTVSMGPLAHTVRNVSFINADVRVIKCTIDNVAVDVTANRTGALGALVLLDAMDLRVNQQHLLKKSLILIKSWCLHESGAYSSQAPSPPTLPGKSMGGQSVLGSSNGALSTYAINTIVISLFNEHGPSLTHPLQALFLFLDRVAEFPWHDSAMTVHGPVALSALPTMPLRKAVRKRDPHRNASVFLDFDEVDQMRLRLQDQFGGFEFSGTAAVGGSSPTLMNGSGGLKMFPIRVCNIVDPLDPYNNLGRSVSSDSFPLIKRACRMGRNRLGRMLLSSSASASDVDEFFVNCCALYARGDGWRPDLLVHPRQTWHGVNSSISASPSPVGDSDEQRWQSIVPDVLHYPVIPTAAVPPFAVAPAVTTPPWSPPPAHHLHHNAPRQQQH